MNIKPRNCRRNRSISVWDNLKRERNINVRLLKIPIFAGTVYEMDEKIRNNNFDFANNLVDNLGDV